MNTSVIIRKLAGHVVPRGYLQEALKNCPKTFGITVQDVDENKNSFLENSAEAKTLSADELFKTIEACKDLPMVIKLGNESDDFDPVDDLQPFVFQMAVEGGDPEDILAVYLEGDFPNYSVPKGGHTEEYNLWEKFIFPMMLEKFDLANSDPEDFYNRLRASTTEQAVMNTVGHRAAIVFVPIEGEMIEFGRNEIGGEFDWGTTSNRFKWGDPSLLDKAAETAVAAVKRSGGRLSKLMGTAAPAPEKVAPKIETDKNGVHHVGNTPIANDDVWKRWPGCTSKTHVMMAVPKKLQGNARNRWIRLFTNNPNGDLPKEKDKDGFMIPVPLPQVGFAQEDHSTNDDVKLLASRVKHFQTTGAVIPGVTNAAMKEAVETPVPAVAPPEEKNVRPAADFLPELTADAKRGTVDLVLEWATRSKGPTKLEIQKIESKWPKFSLMMGITLDNMLNWSIADKKALAKKYPDAMALAFTELQLHILENGVGVAIPDDKQTKTGKQVEVPPTKSEPAPTGKRSRLSQLTGSGKVA